MINNQKFAWSKWFEANIDTLLKKIVNGDKFKDIKNMIEFKEINKYLLFGSFKKQNYRISPL